MIEQEIGGLLRKKGWTLAIAESCTGGLVASRITQVGGSSVYFVGAVVAYANRIKTHVLGVDADLIDQEGAVSEIVARCMAERTRKLFAVDVALATTGIAGPAGGTDAKPVGLVFVALASEEVVNVCRCQFEGDRKTIQRAASDTALKMLRAYIQEQS